ncbi:chitin synthesis regulation, congo red resistance, rcr [Trichoderma arundinaceum]|uniref:Chitin synthesis regulation, congo red resistance, rcr n=1 Tax=Trichoderma arundinaceum TaxID=490622 RepID=A0A395NDR5_TRIAR|nr:chitin synthesis regulation, congo red resistance, rcr [Trichoderma arundinaceum]
MLEVRDDGVPFGWVRENGFLVPWQYSKVGIIVKWSIVAAIFLGFLIFFLGGYLHLQQRLKRGLPPLKYHRFMVRRSMPAASQQSSWVEQGYGQQGAQYMAPPPIYDPARLPVYSGHVDGGAKVDYAQEPTQRTAEANPAPEYDDVPLGPPPPAARR